jgi:transposase
MDILTDSRRVTRLEVVDTGRRRRWTDEEKVRIVEESFSAPRLVSATARRNGISNALLFAWRKAYREGPHGAVAGFVPVNVASEEAASGPPTDGRCTPSRDAASAPACPGQMVIVLGGARRVIVGNDVDGAALERVLDVLERRHSGRGSQSDGR